MQIDHWQHTTLQYSLQKLQYSGVETIQGIQLQCRGNESNHGSNAYKNATQKTNFT